MTVSGNYTQLGKERVEKYLEDKKPYLNPEFKITDMAKDLFSNRSYISAFINREYGMNFNRFINHYRLRSGKITVGSYREKAESIFDGNSYPRRIQQLSQLFSG